VTRAPDETICPGTVIEVGYPFVRDTYNDPADGFAECKTWCPGVRHEWIAPDETVAPDETETVADAMGTQIITVVSTHKPGRFPERVFYTQRWRDPNGREFGKGKLRTKTAQAFRRLIRGYRYEFRLVAPKLELAS
jgi:hypothetical protein